jgi:hypothetical protein
MSPELERLAKKAAADHFDTKDRLSKLEYKMKCLDDELENALIKIYRLTRAITKPLISEASSTEKEKQDDSPE